MFKKTKKILTTLALIVGLLIQTVPASAASPAQDVQDKRGLKPLVSIPVEPSATGQTSFEKNVNSNYIIKNADRNYWEKFSSDFYYDQLTAVEKSAWNKMEDVCLTYASSTLTYDKFSNWIYFDQRLSLDQMEKLVFLFIYSHPQYYFLDGSFSYYTNGSACCFGVYELFEDGNSRHSYTEQFTAKVDQWVNDINAIVQPADKIKYAHDLICLNTEYSFNDYDQSAYSMVCLGETVCAGYTKTLTMLGNAVGVDTSFETSYNHAWNIIKLYDVWYETDATWNDADRDTLIYYNYYAKSRDTFASNDDYNNDHKTESLYGSLLAYAPYDMLNPPSIISYTTPYFTYNGNTYFTINSNPAQGLPIVRCLNQTTALPATVSYDNCTYTVIGGSSASTAAPDSEAVSQVKSFVERMYTVALGRASEPNGLEYWTNSLVSKERDGAGVSSGFLLSPEFVNKNLSNQQYIETLYRTFFNREADAGGLSYWLTTLAKGSVKTEALAGFVNSDEFFNLCQDYGISKGQMLSDGSSINPGIYQFSERLYSKILERDGDRGGLEYWTSALHTRQFSPQYAAESFFNSEEYLNKQTSDELYIMALYRTFMGREADAGGLIYWKNSMGRGMNRNQVLSSFAASNEFQQIMVEYGLAN